MKREIHNNKFANVNGLDMNVVVEVAVATASGVVRFMGTRIYMNTPLQETEGSVSCLCRSMDVCRSHEAIIQGWVMFSNPQVVGAFLPVN
jgi:hypothetical protein